jgi:hypothetical protein
LAAVVSTVRGRGLLSRLFIQAYVLLLKTDFFNYLARLSFSSENAMYDSNAVEIY